MTFESRLPPRETRSHPDPAYLQNSPVAEDDDPYSTVEKPWSRFIALTSLLVSTIAIVIAAFSCNEMQESNALRSRSNEQIEEANEHAREANRLSTEANRLSEQSAASAAEAASEAASANSIAHTALNQQEANSKPILKYADPNIPIFVQRVEPTEEGQDPFFWIGSKVENQSNVEAVALELAIGPTDEPDHEYDAVRFVPDEQYVMAPRRQTTVWAVFDRERSCPRLRRMFEFQVTINFAGTDEVLISPDTTFGNIEGMEDICSGY